MEQITMKENNKFKNTMLTILTAIMLAMSAGIVTADGSTHWTPPMVGLIGTEMV